ncbi:MAG: DUF6468 domain-containing protein [Proteobacteria bacterium]|nr:DUF6468 domain-containing protein [Pseudomonadota bacterium]
MGVILDISVIVLLSLTITFCWRLNAKILELKNGRKDISDLAHMLNKTLINAGKSLEEIKLSSKNAASELSFHTERSKELINELSFVNHSASKLAERLEDLMQDLRFVEDFEKIENHDNKKSAKKSKDTKVQKPHKTLSSYARKIIKKASVITTSKKNDDDGVENYM